MPTAVEFLHDLHYPDLPPTVVEQACRCLLDLAGVAAAGSTTPMSRIARDHAATYHASRTYPARLLFDGRPASPTGAAFAGAATIDSVDAHDGHNLAKGHAGAAVLPALLAFAGTAPTPNGRGFLTSLVVGYEIATRAGIALHTTAADYHTSGAWNALGAAAVGARALALTTDQTRHALGIAEYHGPRSPMMRCIDHPTMVKDGSAAGAAAGADAALLAAASYTGAPAATITDPSTSEVWADLGARWYLTEQYLKPFPVCRWAHPAIQAALTLRELLKHRRATPADIDHLEVTTFHAATRLATRHPTTTEQAQYSLPFAVATALVHGTISPADLVTPQYTHPGVARLAATMILREDPEYEQRFPAERYAHAELVLDTGDRLRTKPTTAPGDSDQPLSGHELATKYRTLTSGVLPPPSAATLEKTIRTLPDGSPITQLLDILLSHP